MTIRRPELSLLENVMCKSIALGFAFFTLTTILGALWAAEVWDGYEKETWTLAKLHGVAVHTFNERLEW